MGILYHTPPEITIIILQFSDKNCLKTFVRHVETFCRKNKPAPRVQNAGAGFFSALRLKQRTQQCKRSADGNVNHKMQDMCPFVVSELVRACDAPQLRIVADEEI